MKRFFLLTAFGFVGALALAFATPSRADDAAPARTPVAAPAARPGATEPPPTQAQFDEGKRIFQNRCARCHGWNMVNLGSLAFDLRQFPHNDRARFFHSVTNGKNAMPAWKEILSQREIEDVWAYVRTGGKL